MTIVILDETTLETNMTVRVQLPVTLRVCAGGQASLELPGGTVAEVMGELAKAYPNLKSHLFNDSGSIRHFVNVYLNDEDIRYLKQTDTPVADGDVITVVPAVAGT